MGGLGCYVNDEGEVRIVLTENRFQGTLITNIHILMDATRVFPN